MFRLRVDDSLKEDESGFDLDLNLALADGHVLYLVFLLAALSLPLHFFPSRAMRHFPEMNKIEADHAYGKKVATRRFHAPGGLSVWLVSVCYPNADGKAKDGDGVEKQRALGSCVARAGEGVVHNGLPVIGAGLELTALLLDGTDN